MLKKNSCIRITLVALLSISLLFGCSEDDSAPDSLTARAGKYTYVVTQGNSQSGEFGQYLEQSVRIEVKDDKGKVVSRPFDFVLSDNTSKVYYDDYSYSMTDTLDLTWKLGCDETNQRLTVIDRNVCSFSGDCKEVEIFTLTATASSTKESGWVAACYPVGFDPSAGFLVSDDQKIIYSKYNKVIATDGLLSEWNELLTPSDFWNNSLKILASGEVLYQSSEGPGILSIDKGTWTQLELPPFKSYSSSGDVIEVFGNGSQYYIDNLEAKLYHRTETADWEQFLNLGRRVQASATDKNKLYFVTIYNRVIEINTDTQEIVWYSFAKESWPQFGSDYQFEMVANDGKVFMTYSDFSTEDVAYILDLEIETVSSMDISSYDRFYKSSGKVYLMESLTKVKEWNTNEFLQIEYETPMFENGLREMYKGRPLGVDRMDNIILYN